MRASRHARIPFALRGAQMHRTATASSRSTVPEVPVGAAAGAAHQGSPSGSSTTTGEGLNSCLGSWRPGTGSRPVRARSSVPADSRESSFTSVPDDTRSAPPKRTSATMNAGKKLEGSASPDVQENASSVPSVSGLSEYYPGSPAAALTSPRKVLRKSIHVPGLEAFELRTEWYGERLYATEPRERADLTAERAPVVVNGKRTASAGSAAGSAGSETRSMLSRLTSFAASGASIMGLGGHQSQNSAAASSPQSTQLVGGGSTGSSPAVAGELQSTSPLGGFLSIGSSVISRRVNYGWGARGTQVSMILIPHAILSMMLMNAYVENASVMAAYRRTFSADSELLASTALAGSGSDVNGRRATVASQVAATSADALRSLTPPPSAVGGNGRERRGLFSRRRASSVRLSDGGSSAGNGPLARIGDATAPEASTEGKAQSRSLIAPELMTLDLERVSCETADMRAGQLEHLAAPNAVPSRSMMSWLNRWTGTSRDKAQTHPSSPALSEGGDAYAAAPSEACEVRADICPDRRTVTTSAGGRTSSLPSTGDCAAVDKRLPGDLVPLLLLNFRDQVFIIQGDTSGRVLQKFRFRVLPTCHTLSLSAAEDTVLAIIGFANGEVLVHRDPLRTLDGGYDCIALPSSLASVAEQTKQVMVMALAVTSSRDRLITARGNGSILVHSLPQGLGPDKYHTSLLAQIPSHAGITSISVHENLLACTSRDGMLHVLALPSLDWPVLAETSANLPSATWIAQARSHYGAFLCMAWSPDGQFIAAGGEDDTFTIWRAPRSPCEEMRCLVRGRGHSSFVTSVCWLPALELELDGYASSSLSGQGWSSEDAAPAAFYRLATVGQDARLCIWELDLNALPSPRKTRRGLVVPEIEPAVRQTIHHDGLTCVRLASLSNRMVLVTADESGAVRLWEMVATAAAAATASPKSSLDAGERSLSWSEKNGNAAGSPGSPTQRIEYLLSIREKHW